MLGFDSQLPTTESPLISLSDNLMILIQNTKLLKFLCNISVISFMDVKMFKPRPTLMMISIYVTHKGKFLKSVFHLIICKAQRECPYALEILPPS